MSSLNYPFPVVPGWESRFSDHEIDKALLTLCVLSLSTLELTTHNAFMNSLLVQSRVLGFALASGGMTGVGHNRCGSVV